MKSRITIEVDFDNNNEAVLSLNLHKSDDVRDKLLQSFIEKFAHQRAWCLAYYMGENATGAMYHIKPLTPFQYEEQANLMREVGIDYINRLPGIKDNN